MFDEKQESAFETDKGSNESTPLLEKVENTHDWKLFARRFYSCGIALLSVTIAYALLRHPCSQTVMTPDMDPNNSHQSASELVDKADQYPKVIELARFRLNEGVSVDEFAMKAEALKSFFVGTEDAVQRSLVYDPKTKFWADVVYWTTMEAALQAAEEIMYTPAAQPFLQSINISSLHLTHSNIGLDWRPLKFGPLVEIAVFPIKAVSAAEFLRQGRATLPFFERVGAAKRRVLSQGDDLELWYGIVYWSSESAAKAAAKEIENDTESKPFLHSIDYESEKFEFKHYNAKLLQQFC